MRCGQPFCTVFFDEFKGVFFEEQEEGGIVGLSLFFGDCIIKDCVLPPEYLYSCATPLAVHLQSCNIFCKRGTIGIISPFLLIDNSHWYWRWQW